MSDLQGYLSIGNSRDILIAMYVILIAVSYVFLSMSITKRRKQIGIFKALGGNTNDILRIFVWEGIVLALLTWVFSTYLGYAYILDTNIKFFFGMPLLQMKWLQVAFNLVLLLIVMLGFIILMVLNTLKNNSVISILKK